MSMAESYGTSPPKFGRVAKSRKFPPPSEDASIMATHGSGTLTNLIRSRSAASLPSMTRRPGSVVSRDTVDDEEAPPAVSDRWPYRMYDGDDPWHPISRRESVLNDPRMRSMRLIGNSNPRYRWQQYWKTEEELKKMRKPMYVYY